MNAKDCAIYSFGFGWLLFVLTGLVMLVMWGCPQYNVYQMRLSGEAKLKEAESSRQIAMQEAHAKFESSKDLAKAEVERAKGVAEANRIIGEGLKGNHAYLMYLFIHNIGEHQHQIIYIPTEAGLPIMEASRFTKNGLDSLKKDKK